MPKPQLYSISFLRTLFDEANTFHFPSTEFKNWRDAFLRLEKLQTEYENNPAAEGTEEARQTALLEASAELNGYLGTYINEKSRKEEKNRSVEEEARLNTARVIQSYAQTVLKNNQDTLQDIRSLQTAVRSLDQIQLNAKKESLNSTFKTLKAQWQKVKNDEGYSVVDEEYYTVITDKFNPEHKVTVSREFVSILGLTELTEPLQEADKQKQLEELKEFFSYYKNENTFKVPETTEKITLRFNPIIKELGKVRFAVQRSGFSADILKSANDFLESDKLKDAVKTEIERYNSLIEKTDFGRNKAPKTIPVPETLSQDFFSQLARDTKDIPGAENLTELTQAIGKMKQLIEKKKNGPEKKDLRLLDSTTALSKKQKELEHSILAKEYELMHASLPKENIVQVDENTTRYTLSSGQSEEIPSALTRMFVGFLEPHKDFLSHFPLKKGDIKVIELENNFDPLEKIPSITEYANNLTDRFVNKRENLTPESFKSTLKEKSKDFRTYLEHTVKYLNTVNQYKKEGVQIELPADCSDREFFRQLEEQTENTSEFKVLSEAASAMQTLYKLADREKQMQDYTELKDEFKKEIDKSSFPSDQFKDMRTQFRKLASAAALPNPEQRNAAFQRVYNAACAYIEYKDPIFWPDHVGKDLPELTQYEKTRVAFAQKLRKHCLEFGAAPEKYRNPEAFKRYDARFADRTSVQKIIRNSVSRDSRSLT